MRMFKNGLMILAIFFVVACGSTSSSGTTPAPGTVDLSTATSLTLFGSAVPADDFATSGDVTVNFIATDSSGAALTAQALSLKNQIRLAVLNTLILPALADTGDISCEVVRIAGSTPTTTTTCTLDSISTIDPLAGFSAMAFLLDGSGSMSGNDPNGLRQTGTVSALEAILAADDASDSNMFSVYDFTTEYPSPLAADLGDYTREIFSWQPISSAAATSVEGASSCEDGTVEEGCLILNGLATPLYQALFDLCTDMNTNSAISSGLKKNIVLLSDGGDTGEGQDTDGDEDVTLEEADIFFNSVLNCLETNNITAYVIGLFESFTTTAAIEAVARSALDPVLTQIAEANTDRPGVYAVARNDTDLDALFASFTDADSLGYNQAVFTISPIPTAGQLIELSISVEGNSNITAVPVSFISE